MFNSKLIEGLCKGNGRWTRSDVSTSAPSGTSPAQTALTGNHIINCVVKDISVGGARLLAPVSEVVPDYFRLNYGSAKEPKCSVRWRQGSELGVAFMLRKKEIALV